MDRRAAGPVSAPSQEHQQLLHMQGKMHRAGELCLQPGQWCRAGGEETGEGQIQDTPPPSNQREVPRHNEAKAQQASRRTEASSARAQARSVKGGKHG